MPDPNDQPFTDAQNEKIIDSLKNEVASLKFELTKKDDRLASQDSMFNMILESHQSRVRDYEDLRSVLEDVVEMLRKRTHPDDILDFVRSEHHKRLW